jgi:hypothetical protein
MYLGVSFKNQKSIRLSASFFHLLLKKELNELLGINSTPPTVLRASAIKRSPGISFVISHHSLPPPSPLACISSFPPFPIGDQK